MMLARISSQSCIRSSSRLIAKPASAQILHRNFTSSSHLKVGNVLFDQTKKNNDPNEENTQEQTQNSKPAPKDQPDKHPAKNPEPEEPTSRSTGIKSEGQAHHAGEGDNKDVHKETREEPGPNMTWGGKK